MLHGTGSVHALIVFDIKLIPCITITAVSQYLIDDLIQFFFLMWTHWSTAFHCFNQKATELFAQDNKSRTELHHILFLFTF